MATQAERLTGLEQAVAQIAQGVAALTQSAAPKVQATKGEWSVLGHIGSVEVRGYVYAAYKKSAPDGKLYLTFEVDKGKFTDRKAVPWEVAVGLGLVSE